MAKKLTSKAETDKEFNRIESEARHHAKHLNPMLRNIYNYVIACTDFKRDKVELYERNGNLARTTWVTYRGKRYVFTYNYKARCVDLREGSLKGQTKRQFDGSEAPGLVVSKLKPFFW